MFESYDIYATNDKIMWDDVSYFNPIITITTILIQAKCSSPAVIWLLELSVIVVGTTVVASIVAVAIDVHACCAAASVVCGEDQSINGCYDVV